MVGIQGYLFFQMLVDNFEVEKMNVTISYIINLKNIWFIQ
jgi:hypothetical protein